MSRFWESFLPVIGQRPRVDRIAKMVFTGHIKVAGSVDTEADVLEKQFQVKGDHLTIHQVRSAAPLYVRLGVDENPFIRVRQGTVLKRPFEKVTVRIGNAATLIGQSSARPRMEMFATFGPLVDQAPKEYGIKPGWIAARNCTIAPGSGGTGLRTFLYATLGTPIDQNHPTVGCGGGTLLIKNTGTQPMLILPYWNFKASVTDDMAWEIASGESLALQLEESLFADNGRHDLIVKDTGGGATFQLLLSSSEADDVNWEQALQHSPAMG